MKKGFTLIELLAVIVILAIIALIATPLVINLIDNARKNSVERSIDGYIDAVENKIASNIINGITDLSTGIYDLPIEGIELDGNPPTDGWLRIQNNKVVDYSLVIDGFVVTRNEETISGTIAIEKPGNYDTYTLGQVVYFDPVNETTCNSTTFPADPTITGNTCFKWRVIEVLDSSSKANITIQLDHNIGNNCGWAPGAEIDTNTTGPLEAMETLNTATLSWTRIPNLTYEYDSSLASTNYGLLSCNNGDCVITGTNTHITGTTRARLITAEEIVAITNTNENVHSDAISKTWALDSTNSFYFSGLDYIMGNETSLTDGGDNNLAWLIENTNTYSGAVRSGSTKSIYGVIPFGYWTLTPTSGEEQGAMMVHFVGHFYMQHIAYYFYGGVRPVITISKSLVSA